MLIEPKLTNTSKHFGKPPDIQNPVSKGFLKTNCHLLLKTLMLFIF